MEVVFVGFSVVPEIKSLAVISAEIVKVERGVRLPA